MLMLEDWSAAMDVGIESITPKSSTSDVIASWTKPSLPWKLGSVQSTSSEEAHSYMTGEPLSDPSSTSSSDVILALNSPSSSPARVIPAKKAAKGLVTPNKGLTRFPSIFTQGNQEGVFPCPIPISVFIPSSCRDGWQRTERC